MTTSMTTSLVVTTKRVKKIIADINDTNSTPGRKLRTFEAKAVEGLSLMALNSDFITHFDMTRHMITVWEKRRRRTEPTDEEILATPEYNKILDKIHDAHNAIKFALNLKYRTSAGLSLLVDSTNEQGRKTGWKSGTVQEAKEEAKRFDEQSEAIVSGLTAGRVMRTQIVEKAISNAASAGQ
jgi:hypothetical protein